MKKNLKKGDEISIKCWHDDCEEKTDVILGEETGIPRDLYKNFFVGQFTIGFSAKFQEFSLDESDGGSGACYCRGCGSFFSRVITVDSPWRREPLTFGYPKSKDG